MPSINRAAAALVFAMLLAATPRAVYAAGNHAGGHGPDDMMENMREMHRSHMHGHDFEAMEAMPPRQAMRMIELMQDIGLAMPPMDSGRGREVFAKKGCAVCHSVNGVGADVGPSLNAADMPAPMNAFDFAARMWRGAAAMTAMQQEEMGGVISLTGQELADLIAFAHDAGEQKKLDISQIPKRFRKMMAQ